MTSRSYFPTPGQAWRSEVVNMPTAITIIAMILVTVTSAIAQKYR